MKPGYYKVYNVAPSSWNPKGDDIWIEITKAEYERLREQPKQASFRLEVIEEGKEAA